MLDELLPYHPKHQLAMDGPVPYNVYDGINLRDQLMVKVENVSRKNKNLRSGDKISGKGTGELNKDLAKAYLRDIENKTGRKVNKEQIHLIKESLRNKNYGKCVLQARSREDCKTQQG